LNSWKNVWTKPVGLSPVAASSAVASRRSSMVRRFVGAALAPSD
jgi:hypothetical protein